MLIAISNCIRPMHSHSDSSSNSTSTMIQFCSFSWRTFAFLSYISGLIRSFTSRPSPAAPCPLLSFLCSPAPSRCHLSHSINRHHFRFILFHSLAASFRFLVSFPDCSLFTSGRSVGHFASTDKLRFFL